MSDTVTDDSDVGGKPDDGDEDEDEDEDEDADEDEDECLPTDDPCEDPSECCGYEGTSQTGDALCAGFGGDYRCTSICRADDECAGDCCVALTANTDHGMCGSCDSLRFGSDAALCYAGVTLFCDCLEGSEEECTDVDRASFQAECLDTSSEFAQTMVCMGGTSSCVEAADDCIPDA